MKRIIVVLICDPQSLHPDPLCLSISIDFWIRTKLKSFILSLFHCLCNTGIRAPPTDRLPLNDNLLKPLNCSATDRQTDIHANILNIGSHHGLVVSSNTPSHDLFCPATTHLTFPSSDPGRRNCCTTVIVLQAAARNE